MPGLGGEVYTYWGHTLFDPDDLAPPGLCAEAPGRGCNAAHIAAVAISRDRQRFSKFPEVMSDFKKVALSFFIWQSSEDLAAEGVLITLLFCAQQAVEGKVAVRAALPSPTQLPALPPGFDAGLIPTDVTGVYEAAGALQALQRLLDLVDLPGDSIPDAGSGKRSCLHLPTVEKP